MTKDTGAFLALTRDAREVVPRPREHAQHDPAAGPTALCPRTVPGLRARVLARGQGRGRAHARAQRVLCLLWPSARLPVRFVRPRSRLGSAPSVDTGGHLNDYTVPPVTLGPIYSPKTRKTTRRCKTLEIKIQESLAMRGAGSPPLPRMHPVIAPRRDKLPHLCRSRLRPTKKGPPAPAGTPP